MIKKGFSYTGIFFLKLLSLLPFSILYIISDLLFAILYYIFRYRRKVVQENLRNSFPDKTEAQLAVIEKAYYRHLADLIIEIVKLDSITEKQILERVKFKNLEVITNLLNDGKSVLACTAHYSNWELGMMAFGICIPAKSYVIYKPLNNTAFDKWFYKVRTRTGNIFITMRQTLRAVAATKNEVTAFCFAGDQTPIREEARHWINFLNQPTAVITGIEKIALQTGRIPIYLDMQRVRRGYYEVECTLINTELAPAGTTEFPITAATFALLENIIRKNPPFWLWSHRRWKHKPIAE